MTDTDSNGSGQYVRVSITKLIDDFKVEIRAGFDKLNFRLDNKADKSDLAELRGRVEGHEQRLNRFPPEYTDRLLAEFHTMETEVADLRASAVTQDVLKKERRFYVSLTTSSLTVFVVNLILHAINPNIP